MPNAINQRIVTLCKEKGYTWYRLSALSGIPVSTIVSIINRNNAPTIPTLQKLCDALGLTLSQFFSEGFETTTKTQDTYLYEFNRLDNHEQDLVLAYIQGMLDAKDIRMEKQAQQEAENIAKGKVRKKGGRKKKNPETIPAGDGQTEEASKVGDGQSAEASPAGDGQSAEASQAGDVQSAEASQAGASQSAENIQDGEALAADRFDSGERQTNENGLTDSEMDINMITEAAPDEA